MKRLLICLLSLLLIITADGCTDDRHAVKLLSEKEALRYAASSFGAAKIVATEKDDAKNSVTYTMQDAEYGFTYSITSYVCEFGLDGSNSGLYYEETSDNFEQQYQQYIVSQINNEGLFLTDTMSYTRAGRETLFSICCTSEEIAQEEARNVIQAVKKVDKRKYFKNFYIGICDEDGNYLGSCDIKTGGFVNQYEEYAEQMLFHFAAEVHGTSSDRSGITYLSYQRLQYKDVERLDLTWLDGDGQTPEDWTTAYYFDYNGKTYFMLDDLVFIKDGEGIEGNHYSRNYTSYWFSED